MSVEILPDMTKAIVTILTESPRLALNVPPSSDYWKPRVKLAQADIASWIS